MVHPRSFKDHHFGMNTDISFSITGEHSAEASDALRHELVRLECMLSRYLDGSDIQNINRHAGIKPVCVNPETCMILSASLSFSKLSKGLFDVTIGPLVDLWNFKQATRAPDKIRINKELSLVNYRSMMIKQGVSMVGLPQSNQSIDLGGIAKGYAGDCCRKILENQKIASGYISIGGNVITLGNKSDGSCWKVGIRHPRESNSLLGAVSVTDTSVVTSGDYERYFDDAEGNRWHHILHPKTGYPAKSGLISVTVVYENSMTADALATTIFVAGKERGLKLLSHFQGAGAVLVDDVQRVSVTNNIASVFQAAEGIDISIL